MHSNSNLNFGLLKGLWSW